MNLRLLPKAKPTREQERRRRLRGWGFTERPPNYPEPETLPPMAEQFEEPEFAPLPEVEKFNWLKEGF